MQCEYTLIENKVPDSTGWYNVMDQRGQEFPCCYVSTFGGKRVWLVPDGIIIVRWRKQ